jgi:hypothetical protein
MGFSRDVRRKARKAVVDGQWSSLYAMVPAMDGGQTYEMKCMVCGAFGNIMARYFDHAPGCPVDIAEKELLRRRRGRSLLVAWATKWWGRGK